MGFGPNWKSKSFSSWETTLALASLVASASAAITRCISFAKHTSLISTLVCKRGRKFIFWIWDSVERQKYMSDQLVRGFFCLSWQWTKIHLRTCIPHLSVARSRSAVNCFAIFSLGKSWMNTEFLKVKRGAMWHQSWNRTKDIYDLPLRKHFGEAVCSQDIPK